VQQRPILTTEAPLAKTGHPAQLSLAGPCYSWAGGGTTFVLYGENRCSSVRGWSSMEKISFDYVRWCFKEGSGSEDDA
jgi:hypothetical protein